MIREIIIGFVCLLFGAVLGYMQHERQSVKEWNTFFDLPIGEFAYLSNPPAVIQKTGVRIIAYRPMPTSDDIKAVRLFPPTQVVEQTTTTTTLSNHRRVK